VGDYCGTYDAQIFDEFESAELGIVPMKYEHAFTARTQSMATTKPVPAAHLSVGSPVRTKVRCCVSELPPPEFSCPEVQRAELVRAMHQAGH